MIRLIVACVIASVHLAVRADDPKPDVQQLKDDVELLEAKLDVWKAKVAGAEKAAAEAKQLLALVHQAEQKGATAMSERVAIGQSWTKAETDLAVNKAEMKVAEVMLNQAKRRLAAVDKGAEKKAEKLFTVRFENAKWADVLDWFAKETGLVNATSNKPTGTVTIKTREGHPYTTTEVVDLLNEMLAPKWLLVRSRQTFALLPADEKPSDDMIPSVEVVDLSKYGRTELVRVVLSVPGNALSDDELDSLRRMVSPFGTLNRLGKEHVVVRDKAGSVLRIDQEIGTLRPKK
jgi:hypothetical protein